MVILQIVLVILQIFSGVASLIGAFFAFTEEPVAFFLLGGGIIGVGLFSFLVDMVQNCIV